jgi:23S rRNA pseudouridine2605 synthase
MLLWIIIAKPNPVVKTAKKRAMKTRNTGAKKPRKKNLSSTKTKQDNLIRLNKFIAHSGICSRRKADELIKAGFITVNGKTIKELGYKVRPTDDVRFKGKKLSGERPVYIVMNKPKDVITTAYDPQGRRTVIDLLGGKVKERVYPVGRLDRNTTGVLLLTNDGELTKKLTHPSSRIPKVYIATLNRPLKKRDLQRLVDGIELEDGKAFADMAAYVDPDDKTKVGIEIHSGKYHIVRRMFAAMGYKVVRLDRIKFAFLDKKDLPRGKWRFLTQKEIGYLKMLAGQQPVSLKQKAKKS